MDLSQLGIGTASSANIRHSYETSNTSKDILVDENSDTEAVFSKLFDENNNSSGETVTNLSDVDPDLVTMLKDMGFQPVENEDGSINKGLYYSQNEDGSIQYVRAEKSGMFSYDLVYNDGSGNEAQRYSFEDVQKNYLQEL